MNDVMVQPPRVLSGLVEGNEEAAGGYWSWQAFLQFEDRPACFSAPAVSQSSTGKEPTRQNKQDGPKKKHLHVFKTSWN